jgi:hypothetical protein
MKKLLRENSLSIALFLLFLFTLIGLIFAGYSYYNQELQTHGEAEVSYSQYLMSGSFIEAVFENWESEFLQMGALVILTIWLVQKGSADSKKIGRKNAVDTSSRYSIIHASTWRTRRKALREALYANSLSLALFGLFVGSFIVHALSGTAAFNQEATTHHEPTITTLQYVGSAQFWYESFQNWQSEFLSVGVLLVLSIYLRQRGSPESKAIGEPNSKTGS